MAEPSRLDRSEGGGLRERAKLDKRRRIMEAALQVFTEHGFEAATTRQIAARADVSIGTVFLYAKDKRDLLLLIVNDDLDAVTAKGLGVRPAATLLDGLAAFFRLRYQYWASKPRLARPVLRETIDFLDPDDGDGEEARRFYARRVLMVGKIGQMVRDAQAAGEVAADVAAEEVAFLVFNLYLIEVRRWLSDESPRLNAGVARLKAVLTLFMRGIYTAR